jgi:hypothetical protein
MGYTLYSIQAPPASMTAAYNFWIIVPMRMTAQKMMKTARLAVLMAMTGIRCSLRNALILSHPLGDLLHCLLRCHIHLLHYQQVFSKLMLKVHTWIYHDRNCAESK